jgi:hypothetical protein
LALVDVTSSYGLEQLGLTRIPDLIGHFVRILRLKTCDTEQREMAMIYLAMYSYATIPIIVLCERNGASRRTHHRQKQIHSERSEAVVVFAIAPFQKEARRTTSSITPSPPSNTVWGNILIVGIKKLCKLEGMLGCCE